MKKFLTHILVLLSVLFATSLFAQVTNDTIEVPINDAIEQQMENLIERADSEIDLTEWIDDISYLQNKPINLNSNLETELLRLPLLNELQIKNLFEYRKEFGDITSLFELINIEGFNEEFIRLITPYVSLSEYVPEKFNLKRAFKYGKTNVFMRYQRVLQNQSGYEKVNDSVFASNPNKYYLGSADALLFRIQYNYKNYLRFGMVAEKDPGETLFPEIDSLKKGFDFYSFHLMLKDIGIIKQLAIGDYRVQLGQGLIMWNGFTMGKMNGSLMARRYGDAIRPHASSNEYSFLRGAGTTIGFKNLDLTVFYAYTPKDGRLIEGDTLMDIEQRIASIQETGYHRTLGELANKKTVKEQTFGGRVSYSFKNLKVGASIVNLNYNLDIDDKTGLYTKYYPSLKQNTYASVDYGTMYKKLTLYGEFAHQFDAGFAFLQGASFSPDARLSLSAVYRNYQKNYFNPKSSAFGESGNNTNESGLYLGIVTLPHKDISISAYVDWFKYNWLKYRVDAPSDGREYATQINYFLGRRGEIIASYRKMYNPQNFQSSEFKLNKVGEIDRTYYRIQFNYQLISWLKAQSRVEFVNRKAPEKNDEKGYIIYNGLQIAPIEKNWSLYLRYALFDTDSYDSRLYTYENDLPYSFSVPAFYGNGSRFYAMFRADLNRSLTFMLRYSITHYNDRDVIGSGLSEIQGNNRSEIKAAIRLKL